ncbi:MAG: zinc-binding dehydrogenase [Burkholderiales bacterium]
MKAIVLREFGGPEVLRYESVATPEPGPDEVLVRLHAVGVNHMEIDVREGRSGFAFPLPHVMGGEGAGEIAAVGAAVTGFAVGDRVMPAPSLSSGSCGDARCYCVRGMDNLCLVFGKLGITCWGSYAGYLRVAPQNLVRLPDGLSYLAAAAGRTIFSTAWELAVRQGAVQAGETVLVNGAAGGVGTAAVAVARQAGARVIGAVGSTDKARRLEELGIDAVINYRDADLATEVKRLTGGRGADLAIETVGGDLLRATVDAMAPGGRIAIGGAHAGEQVRLDIVKLFRKQLRIVTTHSYPKATTAAVFDLMARGRLAPVIAAEFPLADAGRAQALLASRVTVGKIVMHVDGTAH